MARPLTDVNGSAYQELMKQRHLKQEYKEFYPHMKWALETLDTLENKTSHGFFTYEDRVDFEKVKTIIKFVDEVKKSETEKEHSTTHYIWRTQDDGKVRGRHADLDDQVFSWDELPPGGKHPGDDYGCRCWAEPFSPEDEEGRQETKNQYVTSSAADQGSPWDTWELSHYYFYGNGNALRLENIGLLGSVIDYAKTNDTGLILSSGSIFQRVENQIFEEARAKGGSSSFSGSWKRSYRFHGMVFAVGGATVEGNYNVETEDRGKFLIVRADIDYTFKDIFQDPLDVINIVLGEYELPGGRPFDIIGEWKTQLNAIIKKNSATSKYAG